MAADDSRNGKPKKRGDRASSGRDARTRKVEAPGGGDGSAGAEDRPEDAAARPPSQDATAPRTRRRRRPDVPVVGVGASAGGLEAFKELLRAMPPRPGMGFVLIQHLDPTHESLMADLLQKYTAMPVVQVEEPTPIEPNHVYMIPPNKFLRIQDGNLMLDDPVKRRGMRMPIDYFFHSLAEARRERAMCIVLSGTGSDGTIGLREIKAAGGLAIAQQPTTAQYDGMPRSAVATNVVDFVLRIDDMPDALQRYVKHPYVDGEDRTPLDESFPDSFDAVMTVLRAATDYDFRSYKRPTLNRRIQRRMSLCQVESLPDYVRFLRRDPREVRLLFKDLLIGVTRFFRERESWVALEEVVAEIVRERHGLDDPVRVWVPGCATGEEAYGLTMLFFEEFERQKKNLSLQLFGTDIDEDAIAVARAGTYPSSIGQDVTPERLTRFFREEGDHVRVSKRLRETSVFALQNLIADPPFSNLDLISCRNVLIYLEAEVQRRVLEMFHFALRDGGYLFLGNSETLGRASRLFEAISPTHRIHRRLSQVPGRPRALPFSRPRPAKPREGGRRPDPSQLEPPSPTDRAMGLLLDAFAPASVLIDQRHEVLYQHGPLRNYLDFPRGEPSQDLAKLALKGLGSKLRATIHRAMDQGEKAEGYAPRVQRNGDTVGVRITVQPAGALRGAEQAYLVSFRDEAKEEQPRPAPKRPLRPAERAEIQQLEYELQATREDLQSTIEELETANEELKASNEEVMSMNEELQSGNEELETSKEELQSLNEELATVNNQLEEKVDQLESTNNDLGNLLTSTEIATLFLDTDLCIRRFTPATADLMRVIESDIGRPIADLRSRLDDPHLAEDCRAVLRRLQARQREVTSDDGRAFIRRVLPYRTSDNRIDGVVVTLTEISELREAYRRLEQREGQQAQVAALGREALSAPDLQSLLERAVECLCEGLGVELTKVLQVLPDRREFLLRAGAGWSQDVQPGETRVPGGIDSQAGFTMQSAGPVVVEDLAREKRFRGPSLLQAHGVRSGISVLVGSPENPWGVLGVHTRDKRAFSVDDVHFVEAVANVLGDAIRERRIREELRNRARETNLLFRATTARPTSLESALESCIQAVCEVARWPIGHAFLPSRDGRHMESSGIWQVDDRERTAVLRRGSHEFRFSRGEGFVGRIWERREPLSIVDVQAEPYFLRARLGDLPVRGAFGFPVVVEDEVVAILEFFSYEEIQVDEQPLDMVRSLGEQVGIAWERSRAEAERHESAERLALVLEAGGLASWDWDIPRDVTLWSEVHYRLLGYEPGEVEPSFSAWEERVHPDDRARVLEEVERARRERSRYQCEYRLVHPGGRTVWVDARGQFRYDADGEARRMYGVMIDVTAHRTSQALLEEADRRKDAFLAILGHELRNPLAAITSGVETLRQVREPEDSAETREMLGRQALVMSRLLNDLLDVTRISRGEIELQPQRVPLRQTLDHALSTVGAELETRGHAIDVRVEPPDAHFSTDPVRLEQILVNLLHNAIRYTEPDGQLGVELRRHGEELEVVVTDNGAGFSEVQAAVLFEPFYQIQRGSGGLGLGLSLVRQLARLHGGHVEARSDGPGRGSRFTVTLRALDGRPGVASPPAPRAEGALRDRTVLLVDDHDDSARSLAALLSAHCRVETAPDGAQALARARELQPDVVLLDLGLPDMSGLEVARRLRTGEETSDVPLVALTGYGDDQTATQVREAGFDAHILKPVALGRLLRALEDVLPD